ncbi:MULTISPECIES: Fur family transcriptional regulator [Ensifer]|jgi:Fur family zinc uptake transcriptional regulator|uniref:Ferric uptake regulation protein n=1 Tax=Ensifer canadensis TaxID=555315 RepID=A0AAW4FPY4_9HYPH|nr:MULTISPECIES: Fur family transcriptional regulator [Ensifer]AHK44597.1 zinc uptake transcriptional regulator protein, Fur family [Ensifer adhaerens OV14]MDP9630759.1 Fur family zinc uptake transcriptional regulator [Ensifer adhaerens]KQU86124.1 Fur family transcriptional regulator [Ensifer sp. Root31]KQW58792.1 Fur family transcriptional regulator [Ensifer sp. Root1252]KQW74497.1 Fur family transcriptional regulator [Ensifer sp. Root127]
MTTPQLTKNQTMVMNALSHSEGPLSAYTILDKLRDQGFRAPLQVYRALDKLLEYGLVHRLESLNAFVACTCPHEHEHDHGVTAFTICEGCGQVTEFHDTAIEQRLSALTRAQNFKTEKTTIEIRGHCQSCA